MKVEKYHLVGHLEFLPVENGFVSPVFSREGKLFLQVIDVSNIITAFEEIREDNLYQHSESKYSLEVGDECVFAFKYTSVVFYTCANMATYLRTQIRIGSMG